VNDRSTMSLRTDASVAKRLRDAEVDELAAGRCIELVSHDHHVAGLDVAVGHPARVGERESLGDRREEADHFSDATRRHSARALAFDKLLERFSVEPLEHEVGQPGAVRRGDGADVTRLAYRGATFGQLGEEGAFANEARQELGSQLGADLWRLEYLDRNGPLPHVMLGAVDDGERSLGDHPLDQVLASDARARQAARSRRGADGSFRLRHGRRD
jgi:hypothetical protein